MVSRRRHVYWLLLIPIVIPLIPAFFNSEKPTLFGFPLFYWLQLGYILLGVAATTVVYQLTKPGSASASRQECGQGED